MSWDDTKITGNPIAGSDWNDMVDAIKATGSNFSDINILGSGNTYLKVDSTNNIIEMYINGTKVAEWT